MGIANIYNLEAEEEVGWCLPWKSTFFHCCYAFLWTAFAFVIDNLLPVFLFFFFSLILSILWLGSCSLSVYLGVQAAWSQFTSHHSAPGLENFRNSRLCGLIFTLLKLNTDWRSYWRLKRSLSFCTGKFHSCLTSACLKPSCGSQD